MPLRLVVLDPGHFHASLLQREMYPELSPRVSVYAPLGPELIDYLQRVSQFNLRSESPTRWELDVHTSGDAFGAMLRDKPGGIAVFAGHNRGKIDQIVAALESGMHVLADKPWIIRSADLPKLERALALADEKKLAAYDIMTERYEVTSQLQREFVSDVALFGELVPGTAEAPGIFARSVHYIRKTVAGTPLRRPVWFFDSEDYGEALTDVGTHVVDLVQWTAFAEQAVKPGDVRVVQGRRWAMPLTAAQFQQVTGQAVFPAALQAHVKNGALQFHCNNAVQYMLRGVHVSLDILWDWEAPNNHGDLYEATFRGTRLRAEIRQGAAERFVPELYLTPADEATGAAIQRKVTALQGTYPGIGLAAAGPAWHVTIPEVLRVSHAAHFAQVIRRFLAYVKHPEQMPAWERPGTMAKYFITTKGVEGASA